MADTPPPVTFELCISSDFDALCAGVNEIDRVELNSALELGGLTPSIGLAESVVRRLQHHSTKVIAMVRPRPGGFKYEETGSLRVMQCDIDRLLEAGVDGIALGALTSDSAIDAAACTQLIEPVLSAGRQAVFHRAFDFEPDPMAGLEKLIDLGFHRVMTSGGKATAREGAERIRSLIEKAAGRIEILPAGGIRPYNVAELVQKTGCTQVHAALMDNKPDRSLSSNKDIDFNSAPLPRSRFMAADSEAVEKMVDVLKEL